MHAGMQHLLLTSRHGSSPLKLEATNIQPPIVSSTVQLTGFQASFLRAARLGGDSPTQIVLSLRLNGVEVQGLILPREGGSVEHAWTALMPRFEAGAAEPSLGIATMGGAHASVLPSPVPVHSVEVECRVFQEGIDISSQVTTWSDSVSVGLRLVECCGGVFEK